MKKRIAIPFAVVAACAAAALPLRAETFPDHVIKIVVPYPPGGPGDTRNESPETH